MNTLLVNRIVVGAFLALAVSNLRAAEEQDLIATLQSNAPPPQKWAACQRLRMIGSPEAVPALAGLLADERLSQAARHALERLPFPESGEALRQALGRTSGSLKAGIIDSLGWRRDNAAVPLLTPLLSDTDSAMIAAAAAALGRIGGAQAAEALTAALDTHEFAVQEALLKCAERLIADKKSADASSIYRSLLNRNLPVQTRTAAWRGLVLADSDRRVGLVRDALTGRDRPIQVAAMKLLRELADAQVVRACVQQWAELSPESQLAVLDAQVKLGTEALPTARTASQSTDAALRTAAWQALGDLNDIASVAPLAKAAAQSELPEREVAHESLTRLRGPGAREALLACLDKADVPQKAELLRALGDRDDRASINVLLLHAGSDVLPVRQAALESVTKLAPPQAIGPLLEIAAKSNSDEQRDPVLKALYAVCEASPNKEEAARATVKAMERFPAPERRQILPLLAELATPDALAAAETSSRDSELELAKEAVRVLSQWPNAAPANHLLELARASSNPTLQTLALRGAIQVAGHEPAPAKRLALLQQAFSQAKQTEEKKQALGQIGQVPTREALDLAVNHMTDLELASEACLAAVTIAEKLAPSNPKLADQVAAKVLDQVKEGDAVRRAWALRLKPSSGASFIRDWVVCGPYRQPGIVGAVAVFNLAFGPEKSGQIVDWQTVPPADHVNLAALFPGAENCVAYLRTRVIAPRESSGALLMGSDDGIKAWLNGVVVHSNNVDRGEVVDQDAAPIKLKQGENELILKVTQGGGGWSACARIIGSDGKPIPGLMIERPTEPAQPLDASRR